MNSATRRQSSFGVVRGLLFMRWQEVLTGRSILRSCILFAACLGLLLLLKLDPEAEQRFAGLIGTIFTLRFLPIFCLTKGGETLRSELKEGTIEYLWVRPASKVQLYLGLYLSGFVEIMALLLPCVLGVSAAGWAMGLIGLGELAVWWFTTIAATASFAAISTALAAYSSKFVVLGIFYFAFIELGLGGIPNAIRKLSISYHADTLLSGTLASFANACLWMAGICVASLVLGALIFSQSRYVAGSEKEA